MRTATLAIHGTAATVSSTRAALFNRQGTGCTDKLLAVMADVASPPARCQYEKVDRSQYVPWQFLLAILAGNFAINY